MKKILSLLIVLALAASCMFVFASCGGSAKPNSDYEKAAEALEDAGYEVEVDDEDEDCIVIMAYNEDNMMDAIEIRYYADEDDADDAFEELEEELADAEEQIEEAKKMIEEAEEMAEELGIDVDEYLDSLKEMGIDADSIDDIEYKCGQDGTMVWMGTPAAIKAAK